MEPAKSEFWTRTYLGAAMLLKGPTNGVFPCHQKSNTQPGQTDSTRATSAFLSLVASPRQSYTIVCGGGRKSAVDLK
ncbi:hypothetical protein TB1_002066 [Malus domestica]